MSDENKDGRFPQVLKWIGYITAILSFLATLYGLGKFVYDRAETSRKINALLAAESVELKGRDYDSAWHSLEQAAQLKRDSPKVRSAQDALTIAWLDDIDLQRVQKFASIVPKLIPVLSRSIAATKPGPAHADLLARLGWAYHLQFRENTSEVDPEVTFGQAVAEDANNPYANSMWGYFKLWSHYDENYVAEAKKLFAAALDSHRAEDYVRQLQTLALADCSEDPCQEELLRVASAMRREQRRLNSHAAARLFSHYYFEFTGPAAHPARFINILPQAEHLATFHWVFDNFDFDASNRLLRTYYLAILQEAAGDRDGALASYRLSIKGDPPNSGSLWQGATAAIKRLSH